MERHIFLVGMPGSGKSALGRRVALELQMPLSGYRRLSIGNHRHEYRADL